MLGSWQEVNGRKKIENTCPRGTYRLTPGWEPLV